MLKDTGSLLRTRYMEHEQKRAACCSGEGLSPAVAGLSLDAGVGLGLCSCLCRLGAGLCPRCPGRILRMPWVQVCVVPCLEPSLEATAEACCSSVRSWTPRLLHHKQTPKSYEKRGPPTHKPSCGPWADALAACSSVHDCRACLVPAAPATSQTLSCVQKDSLHRRNTVHQDPPFAACVSAPTGC